MQVSVGIGITNDCDLNCAHCYRPQGRIYQLSLDDIRAICERLEVASFNMGTGESWLHPQCRKIAVQQRFTHAVKRDPAKPGRLVDQRAELVHGQVSQALQRPEGPDARLAPRIAPVGDLYVELSWYGIRHHTHWKTVFNKRDLRSGSENRRAPTLLSHLWLPRA